MPADFDLERFVGAQAGTYPAALAELRAGAKRSHWMWFVFPQLRALGRSATARHFGISAAAEARAYLEHPLLGPRLRDATEAVLTHRGIAPEAIFGSIDAMKFRSSMTLFEAVGDPGDPFAAALDAFYAGERDALTLELLGRA